MERFGGRRALTTIAQYFEVNNCIIDKSEHGMKYYFYDISSAFGPLFDPINSLGEILSIPLSGSTTYILVNHGNISFDKKGTDGKEEWNDIKDIAASIWHLCELLLQNMTKFPYVAANSTSTSLDDIIRCIALLEKSHMSIHFYHANEVAYQSDYTRGCSCLLEP